MIGRLEGPYSLPDASGRSTEKENARRGGFEQVLKELEERDPRETRGPQTDSERESLPGGDPARRLQGEGGDTEVEALLLPWQLIPQASLSQLTRAGVVENKVVNAHRDSAIAASVANSANVQFPGQASLSTVTHRSDETMLIAQPWHPRSADAVRKSEEAGASRLSTSSLANPWSERLVRWISDPGQRVTAWVRDYGLEEADMPALIRDLLEHADGQSVQLTRIVVNGQERWNAEKAPTTEPR